MGVDVGVSGMVGGLFEPGDDVSRAWDEAEAILLASEELDAVMGVILEADSPVEARRALKLEFGFTGRQAALLLTLPVMSFTRSERQRLDAGRRARMELLADVTGVLPAITDVDPAATAAPAAYTESALAAAAAPAASGSTFPQPVAESDSDWNTNFGAAFDGVLADISSAMAEPTAAAPPLIAAPPAAAPEPSAFSPEPEQSRTKAQTRTQSRPQADRQPIHRSMSGREEASTVLDEQIGELSDAIAALIGVTPPGGVWSDDPRSSSAESGVLLDHCGVNDATGLRTLLWHLRRTGLDTVEGLLPFAEPLTASQGYDAQSRRFEHAGTAGALGAQPGAEVRWASGLWPIAERGGFGYAVSYGGGPDSGSVWAYGGDEPLHRLWDSVVDLLVDLYQSLTTGSTCDAAVAVPVDGRVVWTNFS